MIRKLLSLAWGFSLLSTAVAQIPPDPENPNEGARFEQNGPNDYTFSWIGYTGRYYFAQHSEDMVTWSYFPDGYVAGAGLPIIYPFSVSGPNRFFLRLKYLESYTGDPLATDYDGDKVSTLDELDNGTDPFDSVLADTDGDGMPDDWEIRFGLLPNDPNDATGPTADPDEDGMDNLTEFGTGADPTDHY